MSRRATRAGVIAFLTMGFWALALPAANAYIDPGSGSLIIQAVVAFFAAIGAGLVVFRDKIRNLFSRKPPSTEDPDSGE